MTKIHLLLCIVISLLTNAYSQSKNTADTAYLRVVTQRADKIAATLGITDTGKYVQVRDIITCQYQSLRDIHDSRNEKVKVVKADSTKSKADKDSMIKTLEAEANVTLKALHDEYLTKLSKFITSDQIDKVKDGMTSGKVQFTYNGYLAMIPNLTDIQKKKIWDWLIEAREIAMDAESSKKKTAVFGRYKGRIANYLSKEGYDLKKEQEEWNKRIKAAQADTTTKK